MMKTIYVAGGCFWGVQHYFDQFDGILKMGRTQLQDAVPMRLGQTFHAYATMVKRDYERLKEVRCEMFTVNLGGTAIGNAINVSLRSGDNFLDGDSYNLVYDKIAEGQIEAGLVQCFNDRLEVLGHGAFSFLLEYSVRECSDTVVYAITIPIHHRIVLEEGVVVQCLAKRLADGAFPAHLRTIVVVDFTVALIFDLGATHGADVLLVAVGVQERDALALRVSEGDDYALNNGQQNVDVGVCHHQCDTSDLQLEILGKDVPLDSRSDSRRMRHGRDGITSQRNEGVECHNEHGMTGFGIGLVKLLIGGGIVILSTLCV